MSDATMPNDLPPAPPEYELTDEEFAANLADSETAREFLDELFREKGEA